MDTIDLMQTCLNGPDGLPLHTLLGWVSSLGWQFHSQSASPGQYNNIMVTMFFTRPAGGDAGGDAEGGAGGDAGGKE